MTKRLFSQSVSNSASTPSLDHAPRDPLFPVAHALTRSFNQLPQFGVRLFFPTNRVLMRAAYSALASL